MQRLLVAIFTLLVFTSFGQTEIKGKVLDTETLEPIPYANIYLKNHPIGTTAFRDGSFKLKLDSVFQDSVIFSIIGYEKKSLFLPDVVKERSLNVKLEPKQEELLEVEVKPRKLKSYEAGLVKRKNNHEMGTLPERPTARFIPNEYQVEGFIKNIAVYISENGIPEAPFRVNLFFADKITGKPGEALIEEDFILKATEKGKAWVELNIEDKLISLPEHGFFVVVQSLPIDSIQMIEYKERLNGVEDRRVQLSAPLFGYFSEPYCEAAITNWCFHCWYENGWVPFWRAHYPKIDSVSNDIDRHSASSLMIKAEINYYADQKLKVKEVKTKRAVKKVFDRPKENTLKYPQSAPAYLLSSLKTAFESGDLPYACSHLLYYDDEEELEEVLTFFESLKDSAGEITLTEKQLNNVNGLLSSLEAELQNLRPSDDERFIFELKHEGELYFFQNKNGAWKINPESTRLVKHNTEIKIPARF